MNMNEYPSINIIDGYPSMNIIDEYPSMIFIDGCPSMNINDGYPSMNETENWSPGVYFDAEYVSTYVCHAKTPYIAIWGKIAKYFVLAENQIILVPCKTSKTYWTPWGPGPHGAQREGTISLMDIHQ